MMIKIYDKITNMIASSKPKEVTNDLEFGKSITDRD